jgi:DNA-binding transcriptional ArsR family regulator
MSALRFRSNWGGKLATSGLREAAGRGTLAPVKTPAEQSTDTPTRLLAVYPSLADLPAGLRRELLHGLTVVQLPAGSTLFRESDACDGFPMVLRGRVRISRVLADGRELHTSHEKLAQRLGTSRETVSRALKVFEGNGWLRPRRGVIEIVRPQPLRALADAGTPSVTAVTERRPGRP